MLRREFLQALGITGLLASVPKGGQAADFARPVYSVAVSRVGWTGVASQLQVDALVYFPVSPQGLCPVVVYSHGLGGSPESLAYLGNMWASRGIVSVFIHHPHTDESQWKGHLRPIADLKRLFEIYWPARDRALAIRFVIDRLTNPGTESSSFAGIIDLSRIGAAGNDLGALAALLVAGQIPPDGGASLHDPRVTAALALSPTVYCESDYAPAVYGGISIPTMTIGGTNDNGIVGPTRAWQRRIPFDAMFKNDRYHVTLNGADHLVYSGRERVVRRQAGDAEFHKAIRSISTLFWTGYLQNDSEALRILQSSAHHVFSKYMSVEFRKSLPNGDTGK